MKSCRGPTFAAVRSFLNGWKNRSATGSKLQAPSAKLQAPSAKLQARPALIRTQLKSKKKLESMKVKEAKLITGTMTRTTKMPGLSYSLPAWECQTGSKLRKVKGTPCYGCYALKGNYTRYPAIKKAQYYRLASLVHDSWVTAMVAQVKRQRWFRWHDAGDVQSVDHMNKILTVCRLTPNTKHWLPTQERPYLPQPEDVPENLVIRLSGSKVDGPAPTAWTHTSSVVTKGASCPSAQQGGKCRECRNCWNKNISNISYGKH